MLKFDISRGATVAGVLLVAIAAMDVLLNSAAAGAVHLVVGGFGFALLAIAAAADAGR